MGMFGILDISSAGMDVQQARLEAAASNIANARTTGENGAVYKPLTVVVRSAIAQEMGAAGTPIDTANLPLPTAEVVTQEVAPKLVYDPGHPDANADGYVQMPNVNTVTEMTDLIGASRAYEANVTAMQTTKSMFARTLDILK